MTIAEGGPDVVCATCDPPYDIEMCPDCPHAVDPGHDRRGNDDCSECDAMTPPGPCATPRPRQRVYRQHAGGLLDDRLLERWVKRRPGNRLDDGSNDALADREDFDAHELGE